MRHVLTDNVWFTLALLALSYPLVFALPRRMPRSVAMMVMLYSLTMAMGLDFSIGVPPFDVYDTNVQPYVTVSDLLTWASFPAFGYLFMYLYVYLGIRGLGLPLYVLGWSLVGTGVETLAVHFHVYDYKHWELRFSFLTYLVVQLLNIALYHAMMKEVRRWPGGKSPSSRARSRDYGHSKAK